MQIVIRPSGVWNSRAPFVNYFAQNRAVGLRFNALVLSGLRLRSDLATPTASMVDLRRFSRANRIAGFAFLGYRRSLGRGQDGNLRDPSPSEFCGHVSEGLQDLYEQVVVKVASLFESFAQCWALNYLLAVLERGDSWTKQEQELADRLCPVLSRRVPSWPEIVSRIPRIGAELKALPHIMSDKNTGKEVDAPVSDVLNAFSVIEFWREYRNLVIHRGGVVSTEFHRRFSPLYEELRAPFLGDIPKLEPYKPIQLSDAVPRAMATTHYRAAGRLARRLAEFSDGRRGHVNAPGPERKPILGEPSVQPNQLLMPGDHESSHRWLHDGVWRIATAAQLHAEARARGVRPPPLPSGISPERSA